jgi:hypothetical protein
MTTGLGHETPVQLAAVVRTDLTTTVLTAGTLGYAQTDPVVNQLAGIYTALPSPGQRIRPGQDLYRVDNLPVMLMRGSTPAWRTFAPGMTAGPDVSELQRNLIALGYCAALAGGGYGVEVAGHERLVGVTTGLFANTLVQVSGPGIRAGMKVVTAQ